MPVPAAELRADVELEGIIKIEYRNEGDWCHGWIGDHRFTGVLPRTVHSQDLVTVQGSWGTHAKHGAQFKVRGIKPTMPSTTRAVESWLATLPNIGPQRAYQIVTRFRADAVRIVAEEPQRLTAINGITEEWHDHLWQ